VRPLLRFHQGRNTPQPEDLPVFVEQLAEALSRQLRPSIECCRPPNTHCLIEPLK
jgi:hypothetical protein